MEQYLYDTFVCKQDASRQNRPINAKIQYCGTGFQNNQNSNSKSNLKYRELTTLIP